LQEVWPAEHVTPHAPLLQVCVLEHALPHAPQFAGSLPVVTQTPLHEVWPAGHWQFPLVHDVEPPQVTPHAPQFALSDGTQALPHNNVPAGQPHTPLVHIWPAAHARPHPPQFCTSLDVGTHWPLHNV